MKAPFVMVDPSTIWSSSQLPTLPAVAVKLLEISRNPTTDVSDIVSLIKSDPAIAAKILKSTNSSFYGFTSKVTSIDHAVPLLGTTVVSSLAMSFSLVEAAMTAGPLAEHYNAFWMRSIVQGATCELLSDYSRRGLECEFFLAGLLMDIGRLAMLKTIPDESVRVMAEAEQQRQDLHEVETELLGFNHVEIGEKLMENWNLPESLITAIQFHHASLSEIQAQKSRPEFELIKAAAVASVTGDYFCTGNKGAALQKLQWMTADLYNFNASSLNEFLEKISSRVDETGDVFSVDTAQLGNPSELMAQANEQLAELAMREHATSAQAVARQRAVEKEKQELASQNRELQQQANIDSLTGIYNRQFFDDAIEKQLESSCRDAATLGVIFIDVDRFKKLNDTYGHQFGDQVLQVVAKAFGNVLRTTDVLARYGGEEFVVLLPRTTEKGLEKVAERIRAHTEAQQITFEGNRVPVTVSVGASLALPGRVESDLGSRLVAAADEAMYESKQNGRNQVHLRSLLAEADRRIAHIVTQCRFSRWLVRRNIFDVPTISKILLESESDRKRIGEIAQQYGYLSASLVDEIIQQQASSQERFGQAAVSMKLMTDEQLVHLLVLQQEEPASLAAALIEAEMLGREEADALLQEYKIEILPARRLDSPSTVEQ